MKSNTDLESPRVPAFAKMPVPNMPNLRRTYQPSSLNGSSSSVSSPFANFRTGNVAHFSHAGSPAPSSYTSPVQRETTVPNSGNSLAPTLPANQPALSAVPGKYNGYADLPNQVYRRSVRKGFALNVIVVGETGTGKSTFINSLFSTDIYNENESPGISHRIGQTIHVEKTRVTLVEKGVQVRLTIVDVPGFGHYVDNSNAWDSVVIYIDKRYHEYLEREMSVKRNLEDQQDDRIHCCLYFIAPNGHGLRPLDIQAMKALGKKVNVIPVIGRADTLTTDECKEFKEKIRKELKENDIKLYDFPTDSDADADDDEDLKRSGRKERDIKSMLPFAVIGSNAFIDTKDGRKVRGRKYPWGTVEIDNSDHCDFTVLRRLLLRIYLSDLMDVTNDVHYENYRCEYFNKAAKSSVEGTPVQHGMKTEQRSPLAQLEAEKKDMESRISRMNSEMQLIFDQKVAEKEKKLEDTQKDLEKKYQNWDRDLEAQKKQLEQERTDLEMQKKVLAESFPNIYDLIQQEMIRTSYSGDSNSSNGSPNGSGAAGTILKKSGKSKKSFLEKGFL